MHHHRNAWLEALSSAEFAALDPWVFINDEESRSQWLAEVRGKLRTVMPDAEIHSILSVGLYTCVERAIQTSPDTKPEDRGQLLIGSSLAFIRRKGIAQIFDEIPGANSYCHGDAMGGRRSHSLQDEYGELISNYSEAIEQEPVFLSEGVVLSDAAMQSQHRLIERIRCLLTFREHQLLRLLVIDAQTPSNISDILGLSAKQIGKIRRNLKLKLAELAGKAGLPAEQVDEYLGSISK
jgi:hypothetical protein